MEIFNKILIFLPLQLVTYRYMPLHVVISRYTKLKLLNGKLFFNLIFLISRNDM